MNKLFRFQDMEIWKEAIVIGKALSRLADGLEARKRFRYAEQLRGAALSISNNIAEGAGSASDIDFANFLNFAHRSAFENANMLLFFHADGHLTEEEISPLLPKLASECRMIEAFRKSLRKS
jgi:four helix bundle protein